MQYVPFINDSQTFLRKIIEISMLGVWMYLCLFTCPLLFPRNGDISWKYYSNKSILRYSKTKTLGREEY